MSPKKAVVVPVCDVTVTVTSWNTTLTRTGTIWSGHVRSMPTVVLRLNVPRPDRVRNVSVSETCVNVRSSPLGCWSLLPRLMQPVVTSAVAVSVAVAVVPAPATSPIADSVADVASFVVVTVGVPTKCRPPLCVIVTAEAACAPTSRQLADVTNMTSALFKDPLLHARYRPLDASRRVEAGTSDGVTRSTWPDYVG